MIRIAALSLLAVVGLVALPMPAHAQRQANITGQKLVDLCASRNATALEACTAYIDGIADGIAFYQRLRPADGSKGPALPDYVCVPANVTGVQLRQTVIEWFRQHPDRAGQQASGIVMNALNQAYLCPGERPRGAAPAPAPASTPEPPK